MPDFGNDPKKTTQQASGKSPFVQRLNICSPLPQKLNHLNAAKKRSEHQRSRAATLIRVQVGPGIEQHRGDLDVALEGHAPERRLPPEIASIGVGITVQQCLHHLRMAVIAGQHEQRVSLMVPQINRQPRSNHGRENGVISGASGIKRDKLQLRVAFLLRLGGNVFHRGGGLGCHWFELVLRLSLNRRVSDRLTQKRLAHSLGVSRIGLRKMAKLSLNDVVGNAVHRLGDILE